MTPSDGKPWPDDPALLPVLPMAYAAWEDGVLSRDEVAALRGSLARLSWLTDAQRAAVATWLDPVAPPSPGDLHGLQRRARALVGPEDGDATRSLADLGVVLAGAGGAPAGATATALAELRTLEGALGVVGTDAARRLLGSAPLERGRGASPPVFDAAALHAFLDADHRALRDEILALLETPALRIPPGTPLAEYRARVLDAVRALAERGYGAWGYPSAFGGRDDAPGAVAIFETLAFGDLSVLVKFGVQFGLFGGSVLQLGTRRHHERYLRDIGTLALPGCYAMTESAHGSNVRDLETTATWDPATGELVIRTPREEAGKDWIGNAALHGRMATVFARLVVRGEDHGVHALLAPIRDERGAVLPGVRVQDRGLKEGLNGVDNGRIWFDGVRVPRENLLDRFASLDASGSYHSPIASPGRRFFTMLGTLVTGRVSIACASVSAAKTGLAIAVRYADRRVQFGPEGEGEVPILDYLVVQRALLPRLAETYGLHFAVRELQRRVGGPSTEPDPELEVRAAGLKAEASRHCLETLQACREACGGRGYLAANRFAALKADTDVFTTFEGANGVLLQLVAKGLLSRYRHEMGDLRFWDMVRFVAERAGESVRALNPIVTRRSDEEHLRDPAFHASSFRYREERLLRSVALRLKRRVDEGMDSFRAINSCQDHLVELATAHVEVLVLEALQDGAARAPTPGLSEALSTLSSLYALWRMETHRGWYLEAGYVEGGKSRAIRGQVNALCGEVREYAGLLVDAFGIPERVLAAPAAGAQDGHEGRASAVL